MAGEVKMDFNISQSLADNLLACKGKSVTVTLQAGQSVTGLVKDVKNDLLHLEKLSQKEFYDALIVLTHVCAVEVRVR
jgi:hypothetical protein